MALIRFAELYTLEGQGQGAFWLGIARRKDGSRFRVRQLGSTTATSDEFFAAPREIIGDAPKKYHPLYVTALLTARNYEEHPQDLLLPVISFTTGADVRRSMTLNAMRMTCEYSQDASPRVLRLISQRLEAGQTDVVHDALVYVMRQILSLRDAMQDENLLRSQALAGYLGIEERNIPLLPVHPSEPFLDMLRINTRRVVDIENIEAMQRRLFRAAVAPLRRAERHQLKLLDCMTDLLRSQ